MTGEKGPVTKLKPGTYTLPRSFSHELSVPVANPSTLIALCTGHRCAAIQRRLEDLRLEAGTVCDGNGLSRRQRVAWTRDLGWTDDVSCLCLKHGEWCIRRWETKVLRLGPITRG